MKRNIKNSESSEFETEISESIDDCSENQNSTANKMAEERQLYQSVREENERKRKDDIAKEEKMKDEMADNIQKSTEKFVRNNKIFKKSSKISDFTRIQEELKLRIKTSGIYSENAKFKIRTARDNWNKAIRRQMEEIRELIRTLRGQFISPNLEDLQQISQIRIEAENIEKEMSTKLTQKSIDIQSSKKRNQNSFKNSDQKENFNIQMENLRLFESQQDKICKTKATNSEKTPMKTETKVNSRIIENGNNTECQTSFGIKQVQNYQSFKSPEYNINTPKNYLSDKNTMDAAIYKNTQTQMCLIERTKLTSANKDEMSNARIIKTESKSTESESESYGQWRKKGQQSIREY